MKTGVPRIVVSALHGGGGKSLLAVGLAAAFRRRGLRVAPFKKGPDYIDAAWLAVAADSVCRNLDPYLMDAPTLLRSFAGAADGSDIAVIEGNRGLYDGVDAAGTYSTAELAKRLAAPVLLAIACTKTSRTVAALALGCQRLDPEVPLRGILLNRTSGPRHEAVLKAAVTQACGLPVVGAIPRLDKTPFPERHLGLVPPPEHGGDVRAVEEAAKIVEAYVDLDAVLEMARQAPAVEAPDDGTSVLPPAAAEPVRIGVFRDAAFQFYYPENLEALAREGGRLVEVSPIRDADLPDVHALYLGGGFPETSARALAENERFRTSLRNRIGEGLPVYAECGGAVYLGERLVVDSREYPMAGVLPVGFGFGPRPVGHGYAIVEAASENPFFPVGATLRGHEFHYIRVIGEMPRDLTFAFRVKRGHGFDGQRDGACVGNVLAAFTHLHALAAPGWAGALVRQAVRFRRA